MKLNLREIIEIPGASLPFSCVLDPAELDFPGVERYSLPPTAEGVVRNAAGALELSGALKAEMTILCDRCVKTFPLKIELPLQVHLAADPGDDENPDIFPLEGDSLDLDELLTTCFVLNMDSKHLCNPDCLGLCPNCGADLNEGPCACGKQIDPRFAGLKQLLDI
ncbi:MAG: DUF177 domain-containing protein [Firmicutes bacterium]|nr:DUF177 domain-containing protein [Bacillota bacterium]